MPACKSAGLFNRWTSCSWLRHLHSFRISPQLCCVARKRKHVHDDLAKHDVHLSHILLKRRQVCANWVEHPPCQAGDKLNHGWLGSIHPPIVSWTILVSQVSSLVPSKCCTVSHESVDRWGPSVPVSHEISKAPWQGPSPVSFSFFWTWIPMPLEP